MPPVFTVQGDNRTGLAVFGRLRFNLLGERVYGRALHTAVYGKPHGVARFRRLRHGGGGHFAGSIRCDALFAVFAAQGRLEHALNAALADGIRIGIAGNV